MKNDYPTSVLPVRVAVDAVIFTIVDGTLRALLIQMKKKPYTDQWAFPGGVLEDGETSKQAAKRILKQQTGVTDVYLEQLQTFDAPDRDVLGRVVSIAYIALVPSDHLRLQTTDKYADVRFWDVSKLPPLAYDHKEIARVALARLRAKIEYSNIAWSILPEEFTLSELQQVYEVILGTTLDKRNFRKKMMGMRLVTSARRKKEGPHRPAELFRFRERKPNILS